MREGFTRTLFLAVESGLGYKMEPVWRHDKFWLIQAGFKIRILFPLCELEWLLLTVAIKVDIHQDREELVFLITLDRLNLIHYFFPRSPPPPTPRPIISEKKNLYIPEEMLMASYHEGFKRYSL